MVATQEKIQNFLFFCAILAATPLPESRPGFFYFRNRFSPSGVFLIPAKSKT
jgi:hypothetical protein